MLVVRDVDGTELHGESGEFALRAQEGAEILVPFREGRFSLAGLPEGRTRVVHAVAFTDEGPRPVAFEQDWFEYRRDEATVLLGHFLPDTVLRVFGADAGVELAEVRVLPGHAGSIQSHPGPHLHGSYVIRDQASPVRLPRKRGTQPYWVTARDHGWGFVLVDHDSGGERVVELDQGGRLVVEVVGDISALTDQSYLAGIRVYRQETQELVTTSDLGPRQGFDGIPVGKHDVRIEVGSPGDGAIVLGETEVDVLPGVTSTARITLIAEEELPRRVGIRGEIVVPRRSRPLDLHPSLRIQPAAGSSLRHGDAVRIVTPHGPALRPVDVLDIESIAMDGRYDESEEDGGDGSEVFRWTVELSSGRYLFVVEPVLHGLVLDVSEAQETTIRIVLPELFPVTLRVIDSRTRQPIPGAAIRWSRSFTKSDPGGWLEMDLDPGTESATVHLTTGDFSFSASAPGHRQATMDAHAGPDVGPLTLELSPCISREVVLMDGETVVPWAGGTGLEYRSYGANELPARESPRDGRMRVCFDQPGLYEFRVSGIEGLRDTGPVVTEVSLDGQSAVVIQLDR